MESKLPSEVNTRRRKILTKYSALALLAYHIPIIVGFLAIFLGYAHYTFKEFSLLYASILFFNMTILIIIQLKREITRNFIKVMLHGQVLISMCHITVAFYIMEDLRYLILICCLLAFIFVFVQSRLSISITVIAVLVSLYLLASYLGSLSAGHHGHFGRDVMTILVFLPVSLFLAYICGILQKQHKKIKESNKKIKSTYAELEEAHQTLASYNHRMLESLQYAEMIQRSLLPGVDRLKTESPESLIIWKPKDIVGGDIFYTYSDPGVTLVVLMDCTGHGVPGAFLTLIAYTEIRKIILEDKCQEPSEILKRMNKTMKNVLHKHSAGRTNDGLDAAVLYVDHYSLLIQYAGAQIPLYYVEDGGRAEQIKADRQSIGYIDSNVNYEFKTHKIKLKQGTCLYLKTDGLTDQLGGEKNLRFGKRRFKALIEGIHSESFARKRLKIMSALADYQGREEQNDDITLISFKM